MNQLNYDKLISHSRDTPFFKFLGFIRLQVSFTWISLFPRSVASSFQLVPFFSTNLCHACQSQSYEANQKQDLKATPGPNTRTTQSFVSESPNAINCWMMLSMTMDTKQVSRK